MCDVKTYLEQAVAMQVSDLFLVAGSPVSVKLDGHLRPLSEEKLLPPDTKVLIEDLYKLAQRPIEAYLSSGDDDFSFSLPGLARFRVNTYHQRGSKAAVIRVVAFSIPDSKKLCIPDEVMKLSSLQHGMVLVTGTAGSGKSTTQACIIDRINKDRDCHIITLEDPIEFLHRNIRSIVSQREIAIDPHDLLSALRACLRQAPDVILLGEMRDTETIRTAMTAAETGHLVISTLHTKGTANAIDRMIDAFPASQQGQARVQLSMVLETVVAQQLIPGINGELLPIFEVLHMNAAAKNLVREGKTHQLANLIAAANNEGMISMDQSILGLYKAGRISREVALSYADNPEQLSRRMN